LKLDAFGRLEWERMFGGPQFVSATAVAAARDGGYLIVGLIDQKSVGLKLDRDGRIDGKALARITNSR
jgi:hypothetical protein